MRARAKAEGPWGRKSTEDALREVQDSVKDAFRGFEESLGGLKLRPWWGGGPEPREPGPGASQGPVAQAAAASTQPGAVSGVSWSPPPAAAPLATTPAVAPATWSAAAPAPAASQSSVAAAVAAAKAREDDGAMRRHCAALERLVVEIGLSPQAARVALRHLDAWLLGEAGKAEMAAAEAAAHSAGEAILHVGDSVRLEGLVKNKDANGKRGELYAYRADDHRWKVILNDGQVYWVRPKLLRPLELKRLPLPDPDAPDRGGEAEPESMTGQAISLAAGWAQLEARQVTQKEELEAREIELLEREMALRKLQESLEQQQALGDSLDVRHARSQPEMHRHGASPGTGSRGVVATYAIASDSPRGPRSPRGASQDESEELGEEKVADDEEEGDVWDMNWATLQPKASASTAGPPVPALPGFQERPSAATGSPSGSVSSEPDRSGGTGDAAGLEQSPQSDEQELAAEDAFHMSIQDSGEPDTGRTAAVNPNAAAAEKLRERGQQPHTAEERFVTPPAAEGG